MVFFQVEVGNLIKKLVTISSSYKGLIVMIIAQSTY